MKMNESKNTPKTAVCYYRSTSNVQNRATIELQRSVAMKYAEDNGIHVIKEYSDIGGMPSIDKRPGIQQLMAEIRNLHVKFVIVWKDNRISRDVIEVAFVEKIIHDAGCEVLYMEENTRKGSREDRLMKAFINQMADHYSKMMNYDVAYEEE